MCVCVCFYSPGVCSWQRTVCWRCYDLEGGAECVEATGRELRGAGGELEETCKLFLSEGGHHGPEPFHHLQTRVQTHTDSTLWTSLLVIKRKGNVYALKMELKQIMRSVKKLAVEMLQTVNTFSIRSSIYHFFLLYQMWTCTVKVVGPVLTYCGVSTFIYSWWIRWQENIEKPITSVWRNKRTQPSMASMLNNKYIMA